MRPNLSLPPSQTKVPCTPTSDFELFREPSELGKRGREPPADGGDACSDLQPRADRRPNRPADSGEWDCLDTDSFLETTRCTWPHVELARTSHSCTCVDVCG